MKPFIGIIMQPDISIENHKILLIYNAIASIINKLDGIIVGISLTNEVDDIKKIIDNCSGVIGQGGDDYTKKELEIIKYIYDNDVPFLGICLSMQAMGMLFNGKMSDIKNLDNKINHKSKSSYVHQISIINNSKLSKIIKGCICVNSRHKSTLICTDLCINAISNDGLIEGIEDKNKKFFIGLQWHPESMFEYDIENKKIFEYFMKICRGDL